jgi:hypothetical protein
MPRRRLGRYLAVSFRRPFFCYSAVLLKESIECTSIPGSRHSLRSGQASSRSPSRECQLQGRPHLASCAAPQLASSTLDGQFMTFLRDFEVATRYWVPSTIPSRGFLAGLDGDKSEHRVVARRQVSVSDKWCYRCKSQWVVRKRG